MSKSIESLRRANPRARAGFQASVDAAADAVRAQIGTARISEPSPVRRRRLAHVYVGGAAVAAVAVVAVSATVWSPGNGTGIESAAAAVRKAATVTAASAERSGTAVVRITHDGEIWAGSTIRWNDGNLAVSSDAPRRRGKAGSELRVVGGTLYGIDPPGGGWVVLGRPENIDPGSGTTPADYLAAVRADVGGVTLRRLTDGMTGLTRRQLADRSSVYSGTVAAGLIARETGFKEGQEIRILPFGYVAHDEAADPAAPLDAAVTVGADGVVREIALRWGTSASSWTYTVTYNRLGGTPAPLAPAKARPLRERLRAGK